MKTECTRLKVHGFTLLEVIVALTIISIGLMAVVPLLITTIKADTQMSLRVRAHYAMAQKMDELLSPEFAAGGSSGADFVNAQTGQVYAGAAPSGTAVITRTWTVGKAPDNQHPLSRITVTTTYTDQEGTKTFASTSLKGN